MLRVLLALLFLSTLIFAQNLRTEKDERLGGYQHVEKTMTNQNKEMDIINYKEEYLAKEMAFQVEIEQQRECKELLEVSAFSRGSKGIRQWLIN